MIAYTIVLYVMMHVFFIIMIFGYYAEILFPETHEIDNLTLCFYY